MMAEQRREEKKNLVDVVDHFETAHASLLCALGGAQLDVARAHDALRCGNDVGRPERRGDVPGLCALAAPRVREDVVGVEHAVPAELAFAELCGVSGLAKHLERDFPRLQPHDLVFARSHLTSFFPFFLSFFRFKTRSTSGKEKKRLQQC